MLGNSTSQSTFFELSRACAYTLVAASLLLATLNAGATSPPLSLGKTVVAGPGWTSFMIHTDGSVVKIKLWATSPKSPNILGAFFYDEQEEFLGGFDFSVHRPEVGAMADINVIPGNPIYENITIQAEPEGGFGMTPTYDPHGVPSTFKVLIFGAGEEVNWSYDGEDNPADVRVLGIDSGTSAFIYLSDEFLAAVNIGIDLLGPGGRVTLMGDLNLDVTDTLIANWTPISSVTTVPSSGVSINRLTITTPKGDEECLYSGLLGCSWPRFHGDMAHGPGHYVFHMTGDGVGLAQNADDVMLYGADARLPLDQTLAVPPIPASIVSRKIHGDAGTFDVDLPLTESPGIECRSGGTNGDYTLVFTFPNPLSSVGGASVTSGIGSVSGSNIDNSDAHKFVVNLTGVSNAQTITVSLANVTDSSGGFGASIPVSMNVLVGDTTGNGTVNSSDIAQTQSQSGQAVTADNFREDVTVNGTVNSSDIALVQSKSGTALP